MHISSHIHHPLLFASFSPPSLCLDFPRPDSCVCCGGFPSHCNGEVRFSQMVFCEEELAVCHRRHWRLHQLHDYHVSQRGRCLDKHHLARLHILSNKCFTKHYLEVCSRNYHIHSQKGFFFPAEIPVCLSVLWSWPTSTSSLLMLMSTIILPGVWKGGLSADKFRWALSTCCMHLYLHYLLLSRWLASIYFLPPVHLTTPFLPPQSTLGQSLSGRTALLWRCSCSSL